MNHGMSNGKLGCPIGKFKDGNAVNGTIWADMGGDGSTCMGDHGQRWEWVGMVAWDSVGILGNGYKTLHIGAAERGVGTHEILRQLQY